MCANIVKRTLLIAGLVIVYDLQKCLDQLVICGAIDLTLRATKKSTGCFVNVIILRFQFSKRTVI